MRKVVRVIVGVLLAYLLQTTVLTHFKINGNMLDMVSIMLFSIGYALGLYAGLMAGLLEALILEVLSGDLPGLTAFLCVAAGAAGAWIAVMLRRVEVAGNRGLERIIKRFGPMAMVGVFVIAKETIYVAYFYLTGMEVSGWHVWRIITAGLEAAIASILLLPLIFNMTRRRPEDTMIAKWKKRRRAKREAKPAKKQPVAGEKLVMPTDANAKP